MKRSPHYLTTGHVAKACEVSLVTVKKWIRLEKLRAFRTPGRHYRVNVEEFQRFRIEYGFPAEHEAPPGILVFQRFRIEYGFPAEHEAPPGILVVDDEPEMVAL